MSACEWNKKEDLLQEQVELLKPVLPTCNSCINSRLWSTWRSTSRSSRSSQPMLEVNWFFAIRWKISQLSRSSVLNISFSLCRFKSSVTTIRTSWSASTRSSCCSTRLRCSPRRWFSSGTRMATHPRAGLSSWIRWRSSSNGWSKLNQVKFLKYPGITKT